MPRWWCSTCWLAVQIDDPEAAEDALDRFTGRLLDAAPAIGPREIGYLCAEFERTGEAEVLDAADRRTAGGG